MVVPPVWRCRLLQIWLGGLLLPLLLLVPAARVAAAPEQAPLGVMVTDLGDFDVQKKTFGATFWLWSVTDDADTSILSSLEFPGALKVETLESLQEATPAGVWVQKKVQGTFRHDWDLRRFPFDRQRLVIRLEEADRDATRLLYRPDTRNSSFHQSLRVPGWRVQSLQLLGGQEEYRSSFGDPRLPPGSPSAYARARVEITLQREDRTAFWKLTAGAFAAVAMALASYGLHVDQGPAVSPRFALLAGSMFAAVISMRSAATDMGAVAYGTLVDQVHLAALAYILVATFAGVRSWSLHRRGSDASRIHRLDRRLAGISSLVLGVVILTLIRGAMA